MYLCCFGKEPNRKVGLDEGRQLGGSEQVCHWNCKTVLLSKCFCFLLGFFFFWLYEGTMLVHLLVQNEKSDEQHVCHLGKWTRACLETLKSHWLTVISNSFSHLCLLASCRKTVKSLLICRFKVILLLLHPETWATKCLCVAEVSRFVGNSEPELFSQHSETNSKLTHLYSADSNSHSQPHVVFNVSETERSRKLSVT